MTTDSTDLSNELSNDLPTDDSASSQAPQASDDAAPPVKKKTAKKTAKKTTKKPAAKKTAKKVAKKTTKKAATKKTAKKVAKKTTKKAAAKSEDEPTAPDSDQPELETLAQAGETSSEPLTEDAAPEAIEAGDEATDSESDDAVPTGPARRTAKKTTKKAPARGPAKAESKSAEPNPAEMIVNYVPGEECRIAIVEDGQLEEFYSEPTGSVSRVGNIYVGRVTNVESSIQAAFVDFGLPENGFLHSSDIHPRYFPSGSDTEQVGKKTPRRDRPPIQQCLKKGQEIIVQVLKEGVGTKGPSLTSYLSVPGRYLVMMPDMDSLGVSRKEDDEDKRREAKKILAQLEIPKGFGFILRTAGFGRTKAELKRDLAYLQRLWADMEKRRKKGNQPRLLYSESDLLLRSLRDLVGAHITRVVIDDPTALERAARFLKIVSPRSQSKLASYDGARPVFYAFGIEEQIKMINSPEVPLPSGGRLIIEQTEALVAIDVNSGKSRSAKDAETNAYKTNMEAADVICRQLRLRDLGGLVINDLIDMRHLRHRKAVEQRFLDRLKGDRAKSTILPISPFGILEMTRQRMRGSQESLNFSECLTCKGRGLTQRPDSVTAEALRMLADIIQHDKVVRAELVVHPKIAGSLLSTRRASLTRVELRSGKKVDVRVSENLPLDRVTIYAYDSSGNDIDVERLKSKKQAPEVTAYDPGEIDDEFATDFAADLKSEADAQSTAALAEQLLHVAKQETDDSVFEIGEGELPAEGDGKKKRRRRRRGGRGRRKEGDEGEGTEESSTENNETQGDKTTERSKPRSQPRAKMPQPESGDAQAESRDEPREERRDEEGHQDHEDSDGTGKKKRRRRRRGGRGRGRTEGSEGEGADTEHTSTDSAEPDRAPEPPTSPAPTASEDRPSEQDSGEPAAKKKRSRRRGRGGQRRSEGESDQNNPDTQASATHEDTGSKPGPSKPRPSKPRPSKSTSSKPASSTEPKAPVKKKRRTLYSNSRRNLSTAETDRAKE